VATPIGLATVGRPVRAVAASPRTGRALLGSVIALLSILPVYRLLGTPDTGLAGAATVSMASAYGNVIVAGTAAAAIVLLVTARFVTWRTVHRVLKVLRATLLGPSAVVFAGALAAVAFLAATAYSRFVLEGQPNLVDAMSQLVHARYLAEGRIAGPVSPFAAFWHIQQTIQIGAGWVSQYPPLHVVLLAFGLASGAATLVGPALLAVAIFFTALAAERLLPAHRASARTGALLAAVSPFLIAHAGAYMSHTTAAALMAIAIYCVARAREGSATWTLGAGSAVGALLATRPLSAVAIGAVVALGCVLGATPPALEPARRLRAAILRLAGLAAGAAPFVIALGAYNARLFGHPFRFGYEAALGPAGGLGFGVDPWGNTFGIVQAIAYTSAELTALGLFLLETPLPLVALVGLWLALAHRITPGAWILAGWAIAPVVANLIYWHHGLFMGPRMLNETAPAWCVLVALAAVWLVQRVPATGESTFGYAPRPALAVTLLAAAVLGGAVLSPLRLASYRTERPAALVLAGVLPAEPLIFVHGTWSGRTAMRLAAAGMRLDSVETALRQNPTCAVHTFADAREHGAAPAAPLDFDRRAAPRSAADRLTRLRVVEIAPGNRIRAMEGERLTAACMREAAADRIGALDIAPLLWQASLPGLDARGPMFVRDLGPERNARLIAAMPERTPYVLIAEDNDRSAVLAGGRAQPEAGAARVVAYAQGIAAIWGAEEAGR
jgi:hypothetical protein